MFRPRKPLCCPRLPWWGPPLGWLTGTQDFGCSSRGPGGHLASVKPQVSSFKAALPARLRFDGPLFERMGTGWGHVLLAVERAASPEAGEGAGTSGESRLWKPAMLQRPAATAGAQGAGLPGCWAAGLALSLAPSAGAGRVASAALRRAGG